MTDTDRAIKDVVGMIVDWYHDLDDSGEGVFGEYARTTVEGNTVIVRHETEDQPCVCITVEASS